MQVPGGKRMGPQGVARFLPSLRAGLVPGEGQGRVLSTETLGSSPTQEGRQSGRVRETLAPAILADVAGIELKRAFPGVLFEPIAPPADLQPQASLLVHQMVKETVPDERRTIGSIPVRDYGFRVLRPVHVWLLSRRRRRPGHVVAAQRVRQPVHEDRVGVTVHADNLKGADDVVVQLASVRVMGVHKDPIPDLEGLVDRPHTLVEVPLVPTLGRGEGGSDLLMRFRKWSRCCSLASRAVLGVVCGYGSLGRRSRANVHTRSGTMNSSGATPVLCCGREL